MDNQQQIYPQCKHYKNSLWVCTDGTAVRTDGVRSPLSTPSGGYKRLTTGELLHRAIYQTFIGDIEKDLEINHIDGNKLNNALSNLEKVTVSQNRNHSIDTLKNSRYGGFITKKKKLSFAQVVEISSYLHNTSLSISAIADLYKVSGTAVQYINIGRNYKWLTGSLFNDHPLRSRAK